MTTIMDKPRRRRRKNPKLHRYVNSRTSSTNDIIQQDAELEQEVDAFLNWGVTHPRKRQRRHNTDSSKNNANCDGDVDENRSLPVLLHFREIGFSRFNKFGRRASSATSWKSRLLHQPIISASTRPEPPLHSLSASQSQWNSLQFSTPTYYGKYSNINSCIDGTKTTSCSIEKKGLLNDFIGADLNDNIYLQRHTWRPYTQHKIPFSKLGTPISDAILALDRSGGYMIGIGSGDENASGNTSKGTLPYLSINFYGVPSPARLKQIQNEDSNAKKTVASPLIHVIPLLSKNSCSSGNDGIFTSPSSILNCNDYASPVAEIPIQILLSNGGSIGVAFLRHSTVVAWSSNNAPTFSKSQDEDTLGAIVIFETPIRCRGSKMSRTCRLNNVSIGWWNSFTIRNALWPTTVVPVREDEKLVDSKCIDSDTAPHYLFRHVRTVLSAHVLFNDEDDGFRITWIVVDENAGPSCCSNPGIPTVTDISPNKIQPTRIDIVTRSEGDIWEECWSDQTTGCVVSDCEAEPCHKGLNIAFEVYLHVDALLSEIISRRHMSLFRKNPYHNERVFFMPDFFYNLVSVSPDSLNVVVVIVFSNKEKMFMQSQKRIPSALGVFVEVNLSDQSYDELKWVQHPSCNDALSMKQWCNSLALNFRMTECRVGVFCLEKSELGQHMESWVCGTHEYNVDEDLGDDRNVQLWGHYLERRRSLVSQGLSAAPPKNISMSSLYPHCDVITNRAVYYGIPVKRIASRDSAIELIYG